jgi:glycosyltransferase involved in cell wall biosynthesis
MAKTLQTLLAERSSYPKGSENDWRQRYAPLVEERIRHRERPNPKVSVVVVAWRSAEFIVECLDHIRDQNGLDDGDIEIILVDNGGLEAARDQFASRVDLEIRMVGNVRLCRARNTGVAWAGAPLLPNIDDDGLIEPDYFKNALYYFNNPDVVAIRSRIVAKDHPYFTTLASHYDRGGWPVEDCLVTEGSSLVRREPYVAVGGFAESLSGHEGIDLTYRLNKHQPTASVLYVPDAVMRHDYFDSWQKFTRKSLYYAGIDDSTADRSPQLARFMDAYFNRDFTRSRRPFDQVAVGAALSIVRGALGVIGRFKSTLPSPTT